MNTDQFLAKWAKETLGRARSGGNVHYEKPVLRSYAEIIAVRLPFDKPPFFYMIPKEAVNFLSVTTSRHWNKARYAADMAGTLIPGCCHTTSWFQSQPNCWKAEEATQGISTDVDRGITELLKFYEQLMNRFRRPVAQCEKLITWKYDLELLLPWCGNRRNEFQRKLDTIRGEIL